MNETTVRIPTEILAASARALTWASRHAEAAALVDAATGAADDALLALARVEATVAKEWHHSRGVDVERLRDAGRIVHEHGTAAQKWDLDHQFAKADYAMQFFSPTGNRRNLSDRVPADMARLRRQVEQLRDAAPDGRRRGWAEFLLGLVGDNVFEEREGSPAHFAAALRCGEEHGDDYLLFESLRHLGDHDHDAGDHELTRQRWERSAHHAAKAGLVGPTLAQLLLVAVSARDRGDEAGAMLLAAEVERWAAAIEFGRIRDMASNFRAGVDPTKAPDDET